MTLGQKKLNDLKIFTLDNFLEYANISRATYYRWKNRGIAPESMNHGGRKLIFSIESINQWRKKMDKIT